MQRRLAATHRIPYTTWGRLGVHPRQNRSPQGMFHVMSWNIARRQKRKQWGDFSEALDGGTPMGHSAPTCMGNVFF